MNGKIFFALLTLFVLTALSAAAGLVEQALHVSATQTDLGHRFLPARWPHILGTDELGRDVLARLLYGGRVSLLVGIVAAAACCGIGTALGMMAGYLGGVWDAVLMRITDFLIALPVLPLLIVLTALDMEKLGFSATAAAHPATSLYKIIVLVSIAGWTTVARLARARTLTLCAADYVLAARALGVPQRRILSRHILPNLADTVLVAAALSVGQVILLESALSFLGLGIRPPLSSWGNMLTHAGAHIWDHAVLALWPGVMIFMTVLSFNLLADGLQEKKSRR